MYDFDSYISTQASTQNFVCCGPTALTRAGLLTLIPGTVGCWTSNTRLHDIYAFYTHFFFNPYKDERIDWDLIPEKNAPNILVPTKERAILECIEFKDYFYEGYILEAVQNYKEWYDLDYDILRANAERYHVSLDELDKWIKEAEESPYLS